MAKRKLKKIDPADTGAFADEAEANSATAALQKRLYDLLYKMFADGRRSLLIILHGIDASGKDGTVSHIFSGANPQGLKVYSFKKPSDEELRHDFFWRCHRLAPEAGSATIFNRSYYEEVTTVRVHPELLKSQHLPLKTTDSKKFFRSRFEQINSFEEILRLNGTSVVKIFLHISKDEQKKRLRERIQDRSKNWKFNEGDIEERKFWNEYQNVFQEMIDETSAKHAPWHVVPADRKWYRNYLVSKLLVDTLEDLDMEFPRIKISPSVKGLLK